MKYFLKGVALGLSLNIANRICCCMHSDDVAFAMSIILFFAVTTAFLVSKKVEHLVFTGFIGLVSMFIGEFVLMALYSWPYGMQLLCYFGGFIGSMMALVVSVILTARKVDLWGHLFRGGKVVVELTKKTKITLMLFTLVSAVCFTLFVMPQNAGISVPMFVIIQTVCLWFLVENKKRLLFMIPVFVMALNCALSVSTVWRVSNLLVSAIMYGCMFTKFSFKKDSFEFFGEVVERTLLPFGRFELPAKWVLELNSEKAPVIKRVAIALAIAIPCAVVLMIVLVNADMVFYVKTDDFLTNLFENINLNSVFKILCGVVAGLFLFGIVYNSYDKREPVANDRTFKGDALIINIFLFVVLVVYTLFVIVQFKYLFAGSTLPDGLSYTEYARKGFFELLWLTGINLAVILAVIRLTRHCEGKTLLFTKLLCHYLCAVTIVLLVSSFYRMLLYTWDDGLTRLRFFVMGFLIFEAVGLLITFVYIAKPRFNIALIYATIAVVYYTALNLVPADNIIAKNQIDIYLRGGRESVHYVFTLSADAAPAVEYLYNNTDDEAIKNAVKRFLEDKTYSEIPERWQRYNFSVKRAADIYEKIKILHMKE